MSHLPNPAEFIFAGKALFTLQSKETGVHYTYRVTTSRDSKMFFVALVQNGAKLYAGCIPADHRTAFRTTRASRVESSHPAIRGFEWFLRNQTSPQVEVHHCGKCGRCGRTLTDPKSIELGIGPECLSKLSGHQQTQVRRDAGWRKVMQGEARYLSQEDAVIENELDEERRAS